MHITYDKRLVFQLQEKIYFISYHTALMSVPLSHISYMTRNDGGDGTRSKRDQRGRAFVLGLRGHLAPLPVLVISLFPSLSCCSILSLSIPSSLLSAQIPSSPTSLISTLHHLPALSLFSAQGDAVLQALIRGPGRREEVGQKVVLETAGEQGWNIE